MSIQPTAPALRQPRHPRKILRPDASFLTALAACAALLTAGAGTLAAPPVQARATMHELNIPAQELGEALKALSAAADEQLLFSLDLVNGKHSAPVQGQYTTDQALQILLRETGLTADRTPSGVLLIRAEGGESTERPAASQKTVSSGTLMVAQGGQVRVAEGDASAAQGKSNDEGEGTAKLEEVVVTAQKRKETLLNVPVSISVLSGEALSHSTIRGVAEALNRVPGVTNLALQANERFGGHTSVVIRGAASADLTGSTTGYYLDSIPFGFVRQNYAPDSSAYDLERVEVLRGPQGTLYGASSMNGVVRVLTHNADLDKFEFKARTSTAETENGSESYRGDMAVNVPLVEGKLAARAVVGYQDIGGWIDKPNEKDANSRKITNARLKINAQPTDQLSLGLFAWRSRTDIGAPTQSADDLHSPSLIKENGAIDYDAYGFTLAYDFGPFSLSSATSYIDFTNDSVVDLQPIAITYNITDDFGNLVDYGSIGSKFDSRVFSQEVYLSSAPQGPWRWTLGGAYRDAAEESWQLRTVGYIAPTESKTFSKSFAAFGELTRLFMDDRFELTGGLRYFKDNMRDREISRLSCVNGLPPNCTGEFPPGLTDYPPLQSPRANFNHTSPRAVLTWHPNKQTNIYTSYSEGFRSGLNQFPSVHAVAPEFPPAQPDKLKNYEIGAKGSTWGGRVNYEAAAFYVDWKDVQQGVGVTLIPGTTIADVAVLNATSASGPGFEYGVTVLPMKGLAVNLNMSWNDLTVDKAVVSSDGSGAVLIGQNDRLLGSAETTAGISVDYTVPLGSNGWTGQFATSANYLSNVVLNRDIEPSGVITVARGAVFESRASFSLVSPGHWTTTLFVDNLGNESGYALDPVTPFWSTWSRPRTIGLQAEYQFH